MAAAIINHGSGGQARRLRGTHIKAVTDAHGNAGGRLPEAVRRRHEAFLEHVAKRFRAGFKEVDSIESHFPKKPMAESPEIKAIAETPRCDRHQLATRPQHLCGRG